MAKLDLLFSNFTKDKSDASSHVQHDAMFQSDDRVFVLISISILYCICIELAFLLEHEKVYHLDQVVDNVLS